MKNVRKLMMVITCMALLGAMQVTAVTYEPQKPLKRNYGQPMPVMTATAPTATFHSTSSMQSSGSIYTTTPALNENGTVNAEAYGVGSSSPRKSKMGGGLVPPDDPDAPIYVDPDNPAQDNPNGFPIGDAVLPLLLMSLAFCGVVYLRRKRAAIES